MKPAMTEQEMRDEARRLSPFFHAIDLPYGVTTWDPSSVRASEEKTRVADLKAQVWPKVESEFSGFSGLRVLDVATNTGGFAVEAARSGAHHVLGIDIVDRYLEQANFVKRATGLEALEFRKLRIEELEPEDVGVFDVVFCFDILYHLENPVLAMRKLAAVTGKTLIIETRTTLDSREEPAWVMNFLPPFQADSLDISTSMWRSQQMCQFLPTPTAVEVLLDYLGFDQVRREPLGVFPGVQSFETDSGLWLYIATREQALT